MNVPLRLLIIHAVICASGCAPPGYREQRVSVSAETLGPYSALFSVDRLAMGFAPLPTNGNVRILTVDRKGWNREYPPPNYDVSFQFFEGSSFYPHTERGVCLKQTPAGLKWVSEQMLYNGPKSYMADDTMVNESIVITREIEQVAYIGTNIQGTEIRYSGPDRRLAPSGNHAEGLSAPEIGPILREWGYSYEADRTKDDPRPSQEAQQSLAPVSGTRGTPAAYAPAAPGIPER